MRAVAVPVGIILLLALVLPLRGGPQTDNSKYAPLPEQIVSAKTVYLMNESGKAKFGDAVYKQLKTWNRWQIVNDKAHADLVLVVTDKGGMKSLNPSFYLNVMDPKTGEQLWVSRTTMQGKLWRSWDSVAQTLVGDIRKRMQGESLNAVPGLILPLENVQAGHSHTKRDRARFAQGMRCGAIDRNSPGQLLGNP